MMSSRREDARLPTAASMRDTGTSPEIRERS
jgi:hypothetical protein